MESAPTSPTKGHSVTFGPDDATDDNVANLDQRARSGSTGSAHKRSFSGSLFSRFQFLKTNLDEKSMDGAADGNVSPVGGATAGAMQHRKSRKRKGSLRKTALLGGRERKSSDAKSKSPLSSPTLVLEDSDLNTASDAKANDATPRQSYELQQRPQPPPLRWSGPRISVASIDSSAPSVDPPSSAASVTSPTAPTEASFTDDDELVEFPRLQTNGLRKLPSSSGDSYFPPQERRRSSAMKASPLATQPHSEVVSPIVDEEWDYSETAYWGYVILIVTWLVFVIGMGSCFGVWSWACRLHLQGHRKLLTTGRGCWRDPIRAAGT